ncbi:MAG: hypothetical protein ACC618_00415 [Patescibacteria group bacterium]
MTAPQVYPKHIYEPIRIQIATDYMKQELRKLLPEVRGKEIWKKIDRSLDDWFGENLSVGGARNFWNGFWGIAMGFKLKITFIQVLTAENIFWRFDENLPLDNKLASGGPLKCISEELSEKRPKASRLREFFEKNQKLANKWRSEFRKQGESSKSREYFPIIAMEEVDNDEEIISIHDGNRKMILSVLEDKTTIPAYVGKYTTEEKTPKNFWLPTSFLMELVQDGEYANGYEEILALLKKLIKLSKSVEYELRERVLVGKNKFRMKLKKDFGWI